MLDYINHVTYNSMDLSKVFGGHDSVEKFQIGAPLILDIVIPAPVPLEIYTMTGDMSRCIGWMMLDPESIRG